MLEQKWLEEERIAHMLGWDFSHIHGRYTEEDDLPWNYAQIIAKYLRPEHKLLDMDTGGGEFLLSIGHPHRNTSATEAWPPNVKLCQDRLAPLGVDFREADASLRLPFDSNAFDIILNRHGSFNVQEIHRTLKPGGYFITQQVGAENDRELVELLLPGTPLPFPDQYLSRTSARFANAGFKIIEGQEAFRPIRFFDVGALVWFAHIIEWEFPGFSVESCMDRLQTAQRLLEEQGCIEGRIHRFMMVAQKTD